MHAYAWKAGPKRNAGGYPYPHQADVWCQLEGGYFPVVAQKKKKRKTGTIYTVRLFKRHALWVPIRMEAGVRPFPSAFFLHRPRDKRTAMLAPRGRGQQPYPNGAHMWCQLRWECFLAYTLSGVCHHKEEDRTVTRKEDQRVTINACVRSESRPQEERGGVPLYTPGGCVVPTGRGVLPGGSQPKKQKKLLNPASFIP
jgi:hypothetical protein